MDTEEYLAPGEVARVLRVSVKTIYRRIAAHQIPGVRNVGTPRHPVYRIPVSSIHSLGHRNHSPPR